MFFQIVSFLALYLFLTNAYAIVNVDSLHLGKNKPGFEAGIKLGFSGASGTTDRFRVNSSANAQWNTEKADHLSRLYYLNLNYAYGESRGTKDQDKAFLHARRIDDISRHLSWELFSQVEYDTFSRLNFRGLFGGGIRFGGPTLNERQLTYLGLGGFFSREEIKTVTGSNDSGQFDIARGNIYLLERFEVTKKFSIFETLYLQPALDEPKDYRILNIFGFQVSVSDKLSISFTLEQTHDNRPPQQVDKTNSIYFSSLNYRF